jgi:hypothetical protein
MTASVADLTDYAQLAEQAAHPGTSLAQIRQIDDHVTRLAATDTGAAADPGATSDVAIARLARQIARLPTLSVPAHLVPLIATSLAQLETAPATADAVGAFERALSEAVATASDVEKRQKRVSNDARQVAASIAYLEAYKSLLDQLPV